MGKVALKHVFFILYGHRRMKKIVNKIESAANGYANDLKT